MWIYIGTSLLFVYAIYKERQALGCSLPLDGSDCANINGKAVIGTETNTSLPTKEILNRIDYAGNYEDRFVKWRSFFIISLITAVGIIYVQHGRFLTQQELILYVSAFMLALTLLNSFYKFHLSNHISANISRSVDILRTR